MRLFSYASPEGTQDKPRGSTHKNVGRVQSAEQHIITVAHVICVAITLNWGALRNQIIDVTVGISSHAVIRLFAEPHAAHAGAPFAPPQRFS